MANEEHIRRLQANVDDWNRWKRSSRERIDLDGVDLSRVDLSGADLQRADLRWTRMPRTALYEADLRGADLSGAVLDSADLTGADLVSARFLLANLRNAKLSHSKLEHTDFRSADLTGTDLRHARLRDATMDRAHLSSADLSGTLMIRVDLSAADLSGAYLSEAHLEDVNLNGANLSRADLSGANLQRINLNNVNLSGTKLTGATFCQVTFVDVDLSHVVGLATCHHRGPSMVDFRTLENSNSLPFAFLRGVGLSNTLIDYLPSLLNQALNYYTCFMSYSSEDDDFAKRLHADLQDNGVRCWFAPHDLAIGAETRSTIDGAIRMRDKLLVILSEHAIKSQWVEDEVEAAYEEEARRGQTVLFPIRLDDAVIDTNEAWAAKLRRSRNIGDFRQWKDHEQYQEAFRSVLRDLNIAQK